MRHVLISALVCFITLNISGQKVSVEVTRANNISVSEWQILNEQYIPVFNGNEYFREDSVYFSLEANKRYIMEVSVSEVSDPDTSIYCLFINNEPVLRIKSDIGPGDHYFAFFTGTRQEHNKITGGTSAGIADYPWQVFYESGNFTCGGSIISGDWIITAAHCTEDDSGNSIPVSQMDVIVGANNPRNALEGKKYFVSRFIRHENYDPVTLNNDIALLQLSATINYVNATPVRLISKIDSASGATDPGVMSWVTGYGLINASPQTYPPNLQKVQLPLISDAQASTVWPTIAETDLMAGYLNGNKDACSGDSGGPMVVPVDNEYKLAGLVSWGSSNCNTYGAYTRISTFESWINSKTGIEISYVPPVPSGDSIVCQGIATSHYSVGTISGVTSYEWQLLPSGAGSIQGNSVQATVTWTQGYTGAATIRLRVTKFNIVSYWSALTVHIAEYNNLISKSDDTIICAGEPVVLNVVSKGYNLNYSWIKDNNIIQSGTSPELSLTNTTTGNSGLYRCDISGSCGQVISPEIGLTVLPVTVINNITPDTQSKFGDDITLEVVADGHNLLYQWQKDSIRISDATSPAYTLLNVNASNTGLYRVMVTGTCGVLLSGNVYVYVTSTENLTNPEVFVWPTVVSNGFNVALSNDQNYDLMLYSSAGTLMKEKLKCQFKTNLDITDLPTGVYILNVSGSKFRKSIKLIKN
jgi:secreted trypsin-like serine protease